jgi:Na+-transporting NADH:ubiquinone oxidoreductase subunit F
MYIEIVVGTLTFIGIVLLLVLLIMAARSRLIPRGSVSIVINDAADQPITAPVGGHLLNALAVHGIYLSSACGGAGTCGLCKCQVLEGGGDVLPTEQEHLNRKQLRERYRLACQVAVKQDMRIRVAEQFFAARKWECRVISNGNLATFIKELVLAIPQGEAIEFRAGGFMQVEAPPFHVQYRDFDIPERFRDDWERFGQFELEAQSSEPVMRAYSMANYPEEKGILIFNVRIASPPPGSQGIPAGKVSSWLFSLKPGDTVTVFGPFGQFFARESDNEMVFVGGGAGMAPMRSHILDQLKRLGSSRKITFWYGARSLKEAFYVDDFNRLAGEYDNFEWHLALSNPLPEDNWSGLSGFIHQVLYEQYLRDHPAPEECEYYLCGPPVMLKSMLSLLDELGVEAGNIFYDDFGG